MSEPQASRHRHTASAGTSPPRPPGGGLLKGLVIFMGILLLVGFAVVFSTILYRTVKLSGSGGGTPSGFGVLDVEVAAGTLVNQLEVDGDRLVIHVSREARDEMLIVDIQRGALLGRVRLRESGDKGGTEAGER